MIAFHSLIHSLNESFLSACSHDRYYGNINTGNYLIMFYSLHGTFSDIISFNSSRCPVR